MEILALIGILYFLIGAFACLLICVNPNNPGLLGKLRSLIFTKLPTIMQTLIKKLLGQKVLHYLSRGKDWLMYSNHPLVQWFYFLIAPGGLIGYSVTGIFRHMPNQYISDGYVVVAYMLAGFCFWIYYKACSVSPGEITQSTVSIYIEKFREYYDGVIYRQNNKCSTCNIVKPPRSKHCSVCKICISKFDHHCVWIRQCVGQKNYKYFVSFLFFHSILCLYFSIIGGISLYASLQNMKFWDLQFRMGNQIVRGDNLLALQYLFVTQTMFFFLIIMCAIMGITLFIFVTYHFYLIHEGLTTNQRVKKNDQIYYLKKQKNKIKKITNQHSQLPQVIEFNGEKVKKEELLEFQSNVNHRLAVLEKDERKGFWKNLKLVFLEPDI